MGQLILGVDTGFVEKGGWREILQSCPFFKTMPKNRYKQDKHLEESTFLLLLSYICVAKCMSDQTS